jgi:hypothetical protein
VIVGRVYEEERSVTQNIPYHELPFPQSDKFHGSFQLAWTAVQVSSSCADAAVTSKSFQNVNCSAFVRQVG